MRTYNPLSFSKVSIQGGFWGARLDTNRERTIPIEYAQCRDTGRIDALRMTWKPGSGTTPHIFWDSDVAKWIEAASYSLVTHPDAQLEALLDDTITLIEHAQQADGYFNTHFTLVEPEKRWTNLRDWHELYCAGHMIEAGVAHYQATGKRNLLKVVCKYADYISQVFGTTPGQKRGYCGHEEIELALVKLYHATGEGRYLTLSQYFIDERGRQPYYFHQEALARGEDPAKFWAKTYAYMQADIPVRQQRHVTGHAVRAMYLYTAMADLVGETGDQELMQAMDALWDHLCNKNMYITGGIGPSRHNEGFTRDYDMPNETAYCETCAAVGLVFWNHRLLQLDCDSKYADIIERTLYNGIISGVSLDGEHFFYENPLASVGEHHRQDWFDCACCPPNLARILASLGDYIYSFNEKEIVVHQFIQGNAEFNLAGQTVKLSQETNYPWEGSVKLRLELNNSSAFELKLRLPGWCRSAKISLNGKSQDAGKLDKGYLILRRTWQSGDEILFEMDMPVERMYAHPEVRQDFGLTALQRGPLVYCLEQADHAFPVNQILLPKEADLSVHFEPDLLGGVMAIKAQGLATDNKKWQGSLYSNQPPSFQPCKLTAIPYYTWDNRQAGGMKVWIPEIS